MANGKKTYRFYKAPIAGLNKSEPAADIADLEAASCQNMMWYEGVAQQRPGFTSTVGPNSCYFAGAHHLHIPTIEHDQQFLLPSVSVLKCYVLRNSLSTVKFCNLRTSGGAGAKWGTIFSASRPMFAPISSAAMSSGGLSADYTSAAWDGSFGEWYGDSLVHMAEFRGGVETRGYIAWSTLEVEPSSRIGFMGELYYEPSGDPRPRVRKMKQVLEDKDPVRARIVRVFAGRINLYNLVDPGDVNPATSWRIESRRVRWGNLAIFTIYDVTSHAANYNDLVDTPGPIINAVPLYNSMIIYKTDAIIDQTHIGSPTTFDFAWNVSEGLFAPNAVANIGDSHIFMGQKDFYRYYGGGNIEAIGGKVFESCFAQIHKGSHPTTGKLYRYRVCAVHFKRYHMVAFFIPTVSSPAPKRAWVYDYDKGTWSMWNTAASVAAWGEYEGWPNSETLMVPITVGREDYTGAYRWDGTDTDDDGTAINQAITTKEIKPQAGPDTSATWDHIIFEATGSGPQAAVVISASVDRGDWSELGTVTLTGGTTMTQYSLDFQLTGKCVQFEFSYDSTRYFALSNYSIREQTGGTP